MGKEVVPPSSSSCFSHEFKKKNVLVLALVLFVCVLVLLNMVSIYFFSIPFSPVAITGRAVDEGIVRLYVEGNPRVITIYPENTTYDSEDYTCTAGGHPKCSDFRYNLPLNVSADFFVDSGAGKGWKYSLYDLEHSVSIKSDESFTPNTTIEAVRWGNQLTVSAYEEDIGWQSQSVIFTVDVPDSSPVLGDIPEEIFVCEGRADRTIQNFNASDVDEETLDAYINPTAVFYTDYLGMRGYNVSLFRIIARLDKEDVGEYVRTISVEDSIGSDSAVTNITVIEVNNAPVINNPLSTETKVYLNGTDSSFNYQWDVTDTEDIDFTSGNLTFNLSWGGPTELFQINSTTGVVNYTPPQGMLGLPITYHLTMCVNDTALDSSHENFSICGGRGFFNESISVCDSFTLTITDENRPPVIIANSPSSPLTVGGTTTTIFNASVSDADMTSGYPDLDWYVNGVLKESNENKSSDTYSWSAGCGTSGIYNITAITNDSLATDSVSWNVTVTRVACPAAPEGGAGGGGGGGGTLAGYCRENWVCDDWQVCQNVEKSFLAKSLSPEDYYNLKELCSQNQYDDRFCGFQITSCQDLELCNSTSPKVPKPSEMKVCYFTENPNCVDGITNCHDGSCELLVDCGGPCKPCPTCSDGIQNQGEAGVDCGGPCPYACEVEEPFKGISFVIISLFILAVIMLGFILVKLVKIVYHLLVGRKRKRKV